MKKTCKKIISMIVSVYIVLMLFVTCSFYRAYAIPGSDPRIYVDIVYENGGTIRADVIVENMPNIRTGAFYLNVGAGWTILPNNHGNTKGLRIDSDDTINLGQYSIAENGTGRFLVFLNTDDNGYDYNGRLCYFHIERTSINNPMNSTLNCTFGDSGGLYGVNFVDITNQAVNPVMLSSYEYLIGDADGNGIIDARDATKILTATTNLTIYNVYSIRNSYTSIFPDAACAAAPDGNEDGVIDSSDATVVMQAYMAMSVGNTPSSNVGQIAIYEVFQ